MGLRPKELAALHEILTWGRESGNNPVLRFFGSTFEDFSDACRTLAAKWKHLLPTGNNRVKVRMTGKDKVKVKETTLGSTLGEESTGLVIFDYEGHPIRYNQIAVFEDIVAKHKSIRCCFVACALDTWVCRKATIASLHGTCVSARITTETSQVRRGICGRRLHLAPSKLFSGDRRGHA